MNGLRKTNMIYKPTMTNPMKFLITFAIIMAVIAYIYEVKTVVQLHSELEHRKTLHNIYKDTSEALLNELMDENIELRYTLFEVTDNPYWIESMYATEEQSNEKTSE